MPRRKKTVAYGEDDSLSDELDDDTEDAFPVKPQKIHKPDQEQWIDKYSPKSTNDLCINPRKLKEVTAAMQAMLKQNPRLLLLTGPSGCGKSTTAKLVAEQLTGNKNCIIEYRDSSIESVSSVFHFPEFLATCRYVGGSTPVFILVEELPNVFQEDTLQAFRKALREWIYTDSSVHLPPVILCLTEVEFENDSTFQHYGIENNISAETLLGKSFLSEGIASGHINRIKFLPIAKSFMKKTLLKIIGKEPSLRSKPPSKLEPVLQSMYEAGDIRSVICNLQFWNLHGHGAVGIRESQISFFHAVGKVIHSSGKFAGFEENTSDQLSVREVVDAYGNFDVLFLGLLENYQIYNGGDFDVGVAANLIDSLSVNDTMAGVEASKDYGVASVRYNLRQVPAKSGRTQTMKFPRHFKAMRELRQTKNRISDYLRYICMLRLSFQEANLLDGYLLPEIYNSFRYKLHHPGTRFRYNRLGGQFREIYADDDVTTTDDMEQGDFLLRDQFAVDIEQKMSEDPQNEDSELSEEVEESDVDTDEDAFDDLLNDSKINELMSHMTQSRQDQDDDDFSDDPELDLLVSQGRL